MTWDPAISRKINVAFEADDVAEFVRSLRKLPEYMRYKDGTDLWMWRAAIDGNLPMLQALVCLGLGVNESNKVDKSTDPPTQLEGPILDASAQGHALVVKWLLDHGAKINYCVNGKNRCLPLKFAAINGHLEVVKLLVEHGADVNSSWNGTTAIQQAETYGHQEIVDYLRSHTS